MKGKRKTPKIPGLLRWHVAENIRTRMEVVYKDSRNRPKALARDAGVSMSTVQRFIGADTGGGLDNLERIAAALKVPTYQLLIPVERALFSTGRATSALHPLLHSPRAGYPVRPRK